MYTKNELIYAFNTWMDDYIANPEEFAREFQAVDSHRQNRDYGQTCADYVEKLLK
jgi:hypothetical protein